VSLTLSPLFDLYSLSDIGTARIVHLYWMCSSHFGGVDISSRERHLWMHMHEK